MAKEEAFKMVGEVVDALPNALFKVDVFDDDEKRTGNVVLCHIAGKMRRNKIRITAGDIVDFDMSPYDLTKGRITFRRR